MSQQALPNQDPGRPGYYGVPPASAPAPVSAAPALASAATVSAGLIEIGRASCRERV